MTPNSNDGRKVNDVSAKTFGQTHGQTDRQTHTDRQTAKLGDGLEDTRTRIKCEVVDVSRCYTLQISTVDGIYSSHYAIPYPPNSMLDSRVSAAIVF